MQSTAVHDPLSLSFEGQDLSLHKTETDVTETEITI